MAKPAVIQQLQKGKLLTGAVFPDFVDTWNYAVNRLENLKGDRDTNPKEGHILVDNSDPEHPVVRFVKDAEESGSGGESGVQKILTEGGDELTKDVTVECPCASGLAVTTTLADDEGSGTLKFDLADRAEDEEYAGRDIEVNGEVVAKVFGTTDFEIQQKKILAGDGIKVTESDDDITIATDGGSASLSGYTGSRTVIVDIDYYNHQLRKKYATETWENGLLKATESGEWEVYHTAVEETV